MKYIVLVYLVFVALMSVIAFAVYGFDKHRARKDGRRVAEKTLHLIALVGGWPGALIGQKTFRHKTQKISFRVVFWLCVVLHVSVIVGVVYLWVYWK